MLIEIIPLDTVFFGDGRPFTMGEDSWTTGIFPPYPSVIYGALRGAYFAQRKHQIADHDFDRQRATIISETEQFCIRRIFYKIGADLVFPLPLDCVNDKQATNTLKIFMLQLHDHNKAVISNYPYEKRLSQNSGPKQKIVEQIEDGLMNKIVFQAYLTDTLKHPFGIQRIGDIVTAEPKVGIGREDRRHAAEESKLFRITSRRLESRLQTRKDSTQKLSILVECDNLDNFTHQGLLGFGGEGKAAAYTQIVDAKMTKAFSLVQPKICREYFKLYLATPTIFKQGWKPKWGSNQTEFYNIFPKARETGLEIQLVAAALGKPLTIGGFDIRAGHPKIMRKAVPAGSVYYFQITKNPRKIPITDIFQGKNSISEYHAKEGFGIYYTGGAQCQPSNL